MTHEQPGAAPPAPPASQVIVPPVGPGDRAAREAGFQVPPDLLADARRGKWLLIGVLGALFLIEAGIIALYVGRFGLRKIDAQTIRLILSAALSVFTYLGHAWARRVLVVLMGVAGLGGMASAIGLIDQPGVALSLFGLSAVFLVCASVLQFSARIRDFTMVQRARR